MSRPVLHLFAISHYCEKARWALDYLGIEHDLKYLMPGPHVEFAKKLGADRSSLPILTVDGVCVQGSADIISWAEQQSAPRTLTLYETREECLAVEQRLDEVIGVHLRRMYYSEAIVDYPQTQRPVFTRDLPLLQKLMLTLSWGEVRKAMIATMDLGPEQRLESRAIVEAELDWLDGLLADGREFLVGDGFTRADLAAASLLAPLAMPPRHPVYGLVEMPPLFRQDQAAWKARPVIAWVRKMYAQFR